MTTFADLPCEVQDIIYTKKHQLEMPDLAKQIRERFFTLLRRSAEVIKKMHKYGKVLRLDPEDELEIWRAIRGYDKDLFPEPVFLLRMTALRSLSHEIYYVEDEEDVLFDVMYWLGSAPRREYRYILDVVPAKSYKGSSLCEIVKRWEDTFKKYEDKVAYEVESNNLL